MSDSAFVDAPASALVIEDDLAIRSLITSVLRRASFVVETACDADAARAQLSLREYELVVLDCRLGDERAMDLLSDLREHMPRTLRRVVIVTADIHVLRHGLPENVCSVIAKPFDLQEFIAAVARCAGDVVN
jgi:two-component system, NtrC family, response regulator PilR